MKIVLITGAAGYIGSCLTKNLLYSGYYVIAVDNLMYKQGHLVHKVFDHPNCTFHNHNVTESDEWLKIAQHCDIVIPLAALVGAPLCEQKKGLATCTNLTAIQRLLRVIPKRTLVIFPNTNSGYGTTGKEACTEQTPLNAISFYGRTKNSAEQAVRKHPQSICFRLATVFGPSYRHRLDLLVNTLTYDANFYRRIQLFEGNFRRNFIYIDDIIYAFLYAIKNRNKMVGHVFNLGLDSANITKMELAEKISDLCPHSVEISVITKEDPDHRDYLVSNEKLNKIGFRAQVSLDEGINKLFDFYSMFPHNTLDHVTPMTIPMYNCLL